MRPKSQVVILNGIGSVGKSSTAKALQAITSKPFLHVAMDTFLDMLPQSLLGHPDGLVFETSHAESEPVVTVKSGPVLDRAMLGMRHAVAAMAGKGNNLIVDEVIVDARVAEEYRDLLKAYDIYLVGLCAPLEVLEVRERARGDRHIGLARGQIAVVHRGIAYDLEVDTEKATPAECAIKIRDAFGL